MEELWQHRRRSSFKGQDELVFTSVHGNPFDPQRYKAIFEEALTRAAVNGRIRPFQDLRHTAITRWAALGTDPMALMHLAGHSSFATTKGYISLAGEDFRPAAEAAQARILGRMGTKAGYQTGSPSSVEQTR